MPRIKLHRHLFGRGGYLEVDGETVVVDAPGFVTPLVVPVRAVAGIALLDILSHSQLLYGHGLVNPQRRYAEINRLLHSNLAIVFTESIVSPDFARRAGRSLPGRPVRGLMLRVSDPGLAVQMLDDIGVSLIEDLAEHLHRTGESRG